MNIETSKSRRGFLLSAARLSASAAAGNMLLGRYALGQPANVALEILGPELDGWGGARIGYLPDIAAWQKILEAIAYNAAERFFFQLRGQPGVRVHLKDFNFHDVARNWIGRDNVFALAGTVLNSGHSLHLGEFCGVVAAAIVNAFIASVAQETLQLLLRNKYGIAEQKAKWIAFSLSYAQLAAYTIWLQPSIEQTLVDTFSPNNELRKLLSASEHTDLNVGEMYASLDFGLLKDHSNVNFATIVVPSWKQELANDSLEQNPSVVETLFVPVADTDIPERGVQPVEIFPRLDGAFQTTVYISVDLSTIPSASLTI